MIPIKDAERAEALLREDVEWAVLNDRWEPGEGAKVTCRQGRTVWFKDCACAVGTMCIRRNLPIIRDESAGYDDVESAARFCGVPSEWMHVIYMTVAGWDREDFDGDTISFDAQAADIGHRLCALAKALHDRVEELT
jgi:hypothetical protein